MNTPAPECIVEIPALLGENPLWIPSEKRLYWLDLMKPVIYRFDPATGKNSTLRADLGSYVSGMVQRQKGGWIVVREDGLSALDLATGRLQPLVNPEPDQPDNMLNDAKCDRQGRLWTGSLDKRETHPCGNHYVIDKKLQVTKVADSLICSNGPAFSPDGRIAYLADSNGRAIYRLAIDPATGKVGPKQPFAQTTVETGMPDGMTVDAEGYLWSARWDGGRVVRHAPDGKRRPRDHAAGAAGDLGRLRRRESRHPLHHHRHHRPHRRATRQGAAVRQPVRLQAGRARSARARLRGIGRPSMQSYDVVIVGGGVMGSSVAYFLKGWLNFPGSVLVVERDPTYADAATPRAAGGIRQQFSTPENIRMGQFAADFIKKAGEYLAVDGDAPLIPFVENGYLFLASGAGMDILRGNHEIQKSLGANNVLLSADEIRARFPLDEHRRTGRRLLWPQQRRLDRSLRPAAGLPPQGPRAGRHLSRGHGHGAEARRPSHDRRDHQGQRRNRLRRRGQFVRLSGAGDRRDRTGSICRCARASAWSMSSNAANSSAACP